MLSQESVVEGRARSSLGLMQIPDFVLFWIRDLFWASFGVTLLVLKWRYRQALNPPRKHLPPRRLTPPVSRARAARVPHGRVRHHVYFGIFSAVASQRVPVWFPGQRVVGGLVIAAGAALMSYALVHFRSWRFRAALERGHQLATGGPFAWLRHPIYVGSHPLGARQRNLDADVGLSGRVRPDGDRQRLRARAEGAHSRAGVRRRMYRSYRQRTRRFVPGVY